MRQSLLTALFASVALATGAHAADTYKFHLYNNTTQYPIVGFETYEDGKWSKWENVRLKPGEDAEMDWNSAEGDCVVPFRVIYSNVETEQYKVDWCKVHNIYVTDSNVTYD